MINAIPAIYDGVPVTDEFFGCYTADAGGGFLDGFFGQPLGGQYFTGDVLSAVRIKANLVPVHSIRRIRSHRQ